MIKKVLLAATLTFGACTGTEQASDITTTAPEETRSASILSLDELSETIREKIKSDPMLTQCLASAEAIIVESDFYQLEIGKFIAKESTYRHYSECANSTMMDSKIGQLMSYVSREIMPLYADSVEYKGHALEGIRLSVGTTGGLNVKSEGIRRAKNQENILNTSFAREI